MLGKHRLRALTVSEILDTALRIYRTHFAVLAGITALMMIPEGLLELGLTLAFSSTEVERLNSSLTTLFTGFAALALIVAISSAYLGDEFAIRSSYSKGFKRFWSVVGANFLKGLAIGIPIMAFACLIIALPPLGIFVLLAMIPVVIYLTTRWSLSSQAIVLENIDGSAGLRRSWEMTRDYFWRVMGTSFAASLLSYMLTIVPSLFIDSALSFTSMPYELVQVIDLVVQQVGLILVLPFTVAVQVLIYYDLRIRKEGFDLQVRAEEPQPAV